MKIVGKRFWTWMSVWVLSFFIRGEMASAHQDRPHESVATSDQNKTTSKTHKVPTADFTRHKSGSGSSGTNLKTDWVKGSSQARKTEYIKKEGSKKSKTHIAKTAKLSTHTRPQ